MILHIGPINPRKLLNNSVNPWKTRVELDGSQNLVKLMKKIILDLRKVKYSIL